MRGSATQTIQYRCTDGRVVHAELLSREPADDGPLPAFLLAHKIVLVAGADPVEFRQLSVPDGADDDPQPGYRALDNEALAGVRLARWEKTGGHPRQTSRLEGIELPGEVPFVLLEPYRGLPVADVAGQLLQQERRDFQTSLLIALRWLAATGLVHRGISPTSVRWDGLDIQITQFHTSSLVGAPRSVVGSPPWAAREQSELRRAVGCLTDRDDVWAVGKLLLFGLHGSEVNREQLNRSPELAELLDGVFGPAETRPPATDLLSRAGIPDPVRHSLPTDEDLERGREEFRRERARKHSPVDVAGSTGGPTDPSAQSSRRRSRRLFRRGDR